jgi:GGDEF domain-containing protein
VSRELLVQQVAAALAAGDRGVDAASASPERAPALLLIQIEDHGALADVESHRADELGTEINSRLDDLVRSGDHLVRLAPDRYGLLAAQVDPSDAGSLADRVRGALAMPLEIGDEVVSLRASVAVAFAQFAIDAEAVVVAAEQQLEAHN